MDVTGNAEFHAKEIVSGQDELDTCKAKITELQEENYSLQIQVAGVNTLSSLLYATREELETISEEKDRLEIELARLECKCNLLEKEKSASESNKVITGPTKQMFEILVKENVKLKEDYQLLLKKKTSEFEKLSALHSPAVREILTFKNEIEVELRRVQESMSSCEGESHISQISRLLGQVAKLEYELQTKEKECVSLIEEVKHLRSNLHQRKEETSNQHVKGGHEKAEQSDFCTQVKPVHLDKETQYEEPVGSTEKQTIKNAVNLRRKKSNRASGDWESIKNKHGELFEEAWNIDEITPKDELKITQDLLVQANEIIMRIADENSQLADLNEDLLRRFGSELSASDVTEKTKDTLIGRLRFMFGESFFEEVEVSTMELNDISASNIETVNQYENSVTLSSCAGADLMNKEKLGTSSQAENMITSTISGSTVSVGAKTIPTDSQSVNKRTKCNLENEISHLKAELLLERQKLTTSEEVIKDLRTKVKDNHINQGLEETEGNKERKTASDSGNRLCNSVGSIPDTVKRPYTYQRVVLETEI